MVVGVTFIYLAQSVTTTNDFLQYRNSGRLPNIVELFGKYCPGVSLCTVNQTDDHGSGSRCCNACSCSSQCFQQGNCCPDVLQYKSDTINKTCVRPQYLPYGVTNSSSYVSYDVIHKCAPDFKDKAITEKCENIPQNPKTFEDFVYTLPVSKINSSLSFRNVYCGRCNGESEEGLVQWKIELTCNSREDLTTTSFDELLHVLYRDRKCNLLYRVPLNIGVRPHPCYWGQFTTCNQTGNMLSYNETLDDMCGAFTSVYADRYRNAFCYLCNDNNPGICPDPGQGIGKFDMLSFTAILDFGLFSSSDSPPLSDTNKCSTNQEYDSYKGVCRNITCAVGSIYVNGSCKRQYIHEAFKSYDIYFKVTTEQEFCVTAMDQFGTELRKSMLSALNNSSVLKDKICSFVAVFLLGTQECSERNSSAMAFVLVHVGLYSSSRHSVDQVLTEMSFLDNSRIIVGSQTFTITIDSRYYGDILFDSSVNTRKYTDSDTNEMLLHLPSHDSSASPCESPIRHMHVTKLTYCRRLFLSSDDYNVVFLHGSVCLDIINLCLIDGTYELKENGLEMCADTYLDHIQNYSGALSMNTCNSNINGNIYTTYEVTSLIFAMISIISLVLTIVTYSLFKSLRTTPGKSNMLLSINLLIAQTLFHFGPGHRTLLFNAGCAVVGSLIHYFWLSAIVWMNICSIHMLRVFYIFRTKTNLLVDKNKEMIVYIVYSVLAPLIIVSINILVSLITSNGSDFGYGGCICYISSKLMLLFTFAIPIGILITTNTICFVIVVIAIRRSQQSKLSSNQDQISIIVYMKLSCLTGASWIFGLLFTWIKLDLFGYIFVILTAGQGFFIFLSFICSKRVLRLYRELRYPSTNENKCSSGSSKSGVSSPLTNSQKYVTRM
ncbi:uncharacterized protein [Argopecten irradians]|uniref:uncharacterized protein n=1 Tax=Argopecten irradians TaxID=31199 RepID=UPI003720E725